MRLHTNEWIYEAEDGSALRSEEIKDVLRDDWIFSDHAYTTFYQSRR
jgi:hypothetical protein